MKNGNTCSEHEASILAGVSSKTLKRFHESGYLHVTLDSEGSPLYSRSEILEIFGSFQNVEQGQAALDPSSSPGCTNFLDDIEHASTSQAVTESLEEGLCSSPYQSASYCPQDEITANGADELVETPLEESVLPDDRTSSATKPQKTESAGLRIEIERLQNLISIQEKMLDSKEDEIADLKNQRAWLRERIERLEEKGERDQILLLSETQTIRSLISYQENKRSPVRLLLEWMGISKPEETETTKSSPTNHSRTGSHRTIEVDKVANE